jgi:hypothetical protein
MDRAEWIDMTYSEEQTVARLAMVLASESGDAVAEILVSVEGLEFREVKELLQDEILVWQARNQFAEDYDNGMII